MKVRKVKVMMVKMVNLRNNTIIKAGGGYGGAKGSLGGGTRWNEQCSSQGVGKCVIRISVRGTKAVLRGEDEYVDVDENAK